MKKTLLITTFIYLFIQIGFSQSFDKSKLDQYFDTLDSNNKFMGSVAVSRNGAIIYSKSVGFSDIENKIKANENTKYRIGSISKTFTAVLIFKAIEKNLLDVNQTIDKYFPNINNAHLISIKMLLNHRSGIHNFTDNKDYLTWNSHPKTGNEMVEIIAKGGSDFEPDSKASYSNSNYVLLTYILEKTFKKTYAQLIQEYISQPIGLKNTYLGSKIITKNNESNSYNFIDAWKIEPETDISVPLGAGGIVSNPIDLTKFSDALFSGRLLKAESLEQMKTMKDNLGLGLFQMPFFNRLGYGHTGGIDGFNSIFTYFYSGNLSYALTSNALNYSNNDISIAVLSAVFNKPYIIPTFKHYKINNEDLDKYLGVYISKQIPLKITITKNNNNLMAQATGQSVFPLESTEKDKFKFDKAGVVVEFNPTEKTMNLKQGGGLFTFSKE